MKNQNSGNSSVRTVIIPEFSSLFAQSSRLNSKSSAAFEYAGAAGRKTLFAARQFLSSVYQDDISDCTCGDEYLVITERIHEFLSKNADTSVIFPGNVFIPKFKISDTTCTRLLKLWENVSLDTTDKDHIPFIKGILEKASSFRGSISLLVNTASLFELYPIISYLWSIGIDLTICNRDAALRKARMIYGCDAHTLAIYNGIISIPGKTAFTDIPFELLPPCDNFDGREYYTAVKEKIFDILISEVCLRFNRSAKRNLVYRTDNNTEFLKAMSILYPHCIGSDDDPHVRGIFSGGALCDVISLLINAHDVSLNMARQLSAACKYCENDYPIRALPTIIDTKYVSSEAEVVSGMSKHAEISEVLFGNTMLDMHVSSKELIPSAKAISNFFSTGGILLKISKGVSREK